MVGTITSANKTATLAFRSCRKRENRRENRIVERKGFSFDGFTDVPDAMQRGVFLLPLAHASAAVSGNGRSCLSGENPPLARQLHGHSTNAFEFQTTVRRPAWQRWSLRDEEVLSPGLAIRKLSLQVPSLRPSQIERRGSFGANSTLALACKSKLPEPAS
jgi:hypothetical protein